MRAKIKAIAGLFLLASSVSAENISVNLTDSASDTLRDYDYDYCSWYPWLCGDTHGHERVHPGHAGHVGGGTHGAGAGAQEDHR